MIQSKQVIITTMPIKKGYIIAVLCLMFGGFLFFPSFARAQTVTTAQLQALIQVLVQQVQVLQSQLNIFIQQQSGQKTPTCNGATVNIVEPPLNNWGENGSFEKLGLDTSTHPEILRYRIQWFDGNWSNWYIPGFGDQDWKNNPDGTPRRVWAYFDDHTHEYVKCLSHSTSQTSITVLSPNGGEVYHVGDPIIIKWKSENIPSNANVSIVLTDSSATAWYKGYSMMLAKQDSVLNNGSYTTIIPMGIPAGQYKVWVWYNPQGYPDTGYLDSSDKPFSIYLR